MVKGGTLYPLLNRLEAAGLVEAEWRAGDGGPGRKYYLLTDDGHHELQGTAGRWSRFTGVIGTLISGGHVDAGPEQGHKFAEDPLRLPSTMR